MSNLDDIIAAASTAAKETATVELAVGAHLVTFEFQQLDGLAWVDLTNAHPRREKSSTDANLGFNAHSLGRDYDPDCITHIDGGERNPVSQKQWQAVFDALSAPGIELVAVTLWGVNVLDPQNRVAELKKASTGNSEKSSALPVSSENPSVVSSDESPAKSRRMSTTKKAG